MRAVRSRRLEICAAAGGRGGRGEVGCTLLISALWGFVCGGESHSWREGRGLRNINRIGFEYGYAMACLKMGGWMDGEGREDVCFEKVNERTNERSCLSDRVGTLRLSLLRATVRDIASCTVFSQREMRLRCGLLDSLFNPPSSLLTCLLCFF